MLEDPGGPTPYTTLRHRDITFHPTPGHPQAMLNSQSELNSNCKVFISCVQTGVRVSNTEKSEALISNFVLKSSQVQRKSRRRKKITLQLFALSSKQPLVIRSAKGKLEYNFFWIFTIFLDENLVILSRRNENLRKSRIKVSHTTQQTGLACNHLYIFGTEFVNAS